MAPLSRRLGAFTGASIRHVVVCLVLAPYPWATCLAQSGPSQVDEALEVLRTYEWGQDEAPLREAEALVLGSIPGSAARRDVEDRLCLLVHGQITRAGLQIAARLLASIGSARAVPGLARTLAMPGRQDAARVALERIPGPEASAALRRALGTAAGLSRIGLIDSIAARRDGAAVPVLSSYATSADAPLSRAAVSALVRIGTPRAVAALERCERIAPASTREYVQAACVAVAAGLSGPGPRGTATALLTTRLRDTSSARVRAAAFRGLLLADPDSATRRIRSALWGRDPVVRLEAVRAIEEAPAGSSLAPFLRGFAGLPAAVRVDLLEALTRRADPRAREVARSAARSGPTATRAAAIRALGVVGAASDVAMLATTAAFERGALASAALAALRSLSAPGVELALLGATADHTPTTRTVALEILRYRGAANSTRRAAALLADPNSAVRTAAIRLLGAVGGPDQASRLLTLLRADPDEKARQACAAALEGIAGRSPRAMEGFLVPALAGATPDVQQALLPILPLVGGADALSAVRACVADRVDTTRDTAIATLAEWPDGAAAACLLGIARETADPKHRGVAFRGYIRLCREQPGPARDRLRMLAEARDLAANAAERRQVIGALGLVADGAALAYLTHYLDDPEVRLEAQHAIVAICEQMPQAPEPSAPDVLRRIARESADPELSSRARAAGKRLTTVPAPAAPSR